MPAYRVLTPVSHDGRDYAPGASLDVSGDAADALLRVRAIEPAPEPEKGDKKKGGAGA